MNSITIYKDNMCDNTVISNKFIDEYMVDANDAQIKVYLYLMRMMSANLPTGISDMADKFNHTEKDILRALKYWEKCHVLTLEFDEAKNLTGIRFLSSTESKADEVRPLAPIVPLKLVAQEVSEKPSVPSEMPTYSRDQLKQIKDSPVLMLAETYFKKTLAKSDIEVLYFIHYDLQFTEDLIDFLLQYCAEKDKKAFSYVRKVAINWAEEGIKTPKQAKAYIGSSYDKDIFTVMKALGRTGAPTPVEVDIITRWSKELGYDMEVISEACKRAALKDSNRLQYCDKVLRNWKADGIRNLEDISKQDLSFKKAKTTSSQPKNSFNNFSMASGYDMDELEKILLSK